MPNSTLFPLNREPMKPSPERREPVLWLKRLVILSALDSASIVRNIEFRRGLNIVQTRQMETRGGPVAGHSVGKTLLVRLIRYTLGESHFGTEETEANVATAFETGFVVAHWRIAGADWIVVRPLNRAGSVDSMAAQNDNWQNVVDKHSEETAYKNFSNAIGKAVLAALPTFTLPRGREAKWMDVLAWVSRDYQCGYRRANEWRHEDANSGPCLDREENSQIMQWLLGLMSEEEVDLRLKHSKLLDEQSKLRRNGDREQKRLDALWPSLREKLELDEDAEVPGEQATFNSVNPMNVVTQRIKSLEELRKERLAEPQIAKWEEEQRVIQERVTDAEATIRSCNYRIRFIDKQIEEYEADPTKPFAKCQADPCWIREQAKKTAFDPAKDHHLVELNRERDEQRKMLADTKLQKASLVENLRRADDELKRERARIANEVSGIDENIGRWKGSKEDANTFQKVVTSVAQTMKAIGRAEGSVRASLQVQESVRSKYRKEIEKLTHVYQDTLQRIFGEKADGQIQVDGNGLQPVPDKRLAPTGAALSVMTTVLAFDIACVAASIVGMGQHPRFLMHDSPREGDMEGPLFRRLFEIVAELENEFTETDSVSFQYIVTTTTTPPTELGSEDGPFVRETLDARNEKGLLLKKRF